MKKIIKKIELEARKFFVGASGCHDWTHVERVRNLAVRIAKKEKADLFIVEVAALLHDIGRKSEMANKGLFCHAVQGGILARKILKKYDLKKETIENIIHAIEAHRFRENLPPRTLEARVVYDADKLDSIGAVGIGRDFIFAGHSGSNSLYTGNEKKLAKSGKDYSFTKEDSPILEYEIKLKKIKNKILTKEGRRIARERHDYMVGFFNRFEKEITGVL
jgi:uncharacterized protein